jgi:hypothetical protein
VIYYQPQFGLGNIVQTSPAVRFLQKRDRVTLISSPTTDAFIRAVFPGVPVIGANAATVAPAECFRSVHPSEFKQGGTVSEVEANLRRVGWGADPLTVDEQDRCGGCGHAACFEGFDVVFANGYNKTRNLTDWEAKTYPHMEHVAAVLLSLGFKVATVGTPGEHIPGTVDRTGVGLFKTFGLIQRARLFVSNDTGLYHVAAALGIPALALFTFTDTAKNYDRIFHRSARILSRGLACQPCQLKGAQYWIQNRPQCQWACRDIPPPEVIDAIREALA